MSQINLSLRLILRFRLAVEPALRQLVAYTELEIGCESALALFMPGEAAGAAGLTAASRRLGSRQTQRVSVSMRRGPRRSPCRRHVACTGVSGATYPSWPRLATGAWPWQPRLPSFGLCRTCPASLSCPWPSGICRPSSTAASLSVCTGSINALFPEGQKYRATVCAALLPFERYVVNGRCLLHSGRWRGLP